MADEVTILRAPARWTLAELAAMAAGPLRRAGALRAVAFGSYARGTADAYSDLDLAVVLDTAQAPLERPRRLRELLDALPVPVDLLVFTPEELARGLEGRRGIFASIAATGVPFYA
jgi:predicted nucleotidyltransferase